MKKGFMCVFLAALIAAFGAVTVSAAPADGARREDEIRNICMQDKRVKDAVCIFFGSTCAVALRCETIYFTDQLNALKAEVIKNIKERYPEADKIYVKCDLDIFLKAKKADDKLKKGASVLSLKDELLEILRLAEKRT